MMAEKHLNLKVCAFGLACGIVWGVSVFILSMASWLIPNWGGPIIDLISSGYVGYEAGPLGGFIGLIWGFIDGFIGGAVFAWVYNFCCNCCCPAKKSKK